MASVRVPFVLDFPQEQDFPESAADHAGKNRIPTENGVSLRKENIVGAIISNKFLRSCSAENPAPERNPGLERNQNDANFKKKVRRNKLKNKCDLEIH
jgi:hypothetical protein